MYCSVMIYLEPSHCISPKSHQTPKSAPAPCVEHAQMRSLCVQWTGVEIVSQYIINMFYDSRHTIQVRACTKKEKKPKSSPNIMFKKKLWFFSPYYVVFFHIICMSWHRVSCARAVTAIQYIVIVIIYYIVMNKKIEDIIKKTIESFAARRHGILHRLEGRQTGGRKDRIKKKNVKYYVPTTCSGVHICTESAAAVTRLGAHPLHSRVHCSASE